jgi:hypothetical protein
LVTTFGPLAPPEDELLLDDDDDDEEELLLPLDEDEEDELELLEELLDELVLPMPLLLVVVLPLLLEPLPLVLELTAGGFGGLLLLFLRFLPQPVSIELAKIKHSDTEVKLLKFTAFLIKYCLFIATFSFLYPKH